MDCERVRDSLSEHIEGTLPPPEREAVERHVERCAPCRAVREELAALLEELAHLPTLAAPPELLARVLARVDGLAGHPAPVAAAATAPAPRRSAWLGAARAAAVLLFVALGYGIGTEIFRRPPGTAAPTEVAMLAAPSPAPPSPAEREPGTPRRVAIPSAEREAAPSAPRLASVPGGATMEVPRRLPQEIPGTAPVSTAPPEPSPAQVVPIVPPGAVHLAAAPREVILFVPAAARRDAAERVALAARRCGALPPGHPPLPSAAPRPAPDQEGAVVRVTLPRPEAARFVSELRAIGSVAPAFAVLPRGAEEGEQVPFTVRLVAR